MAEHAAAMSECWTVSGWEIKGQRRGRVCGRDVAAHIHSNQAAVLADLTRWRTQRKGIILNRLFKRKKEKAKADGNL